MTNEELCLRYQSGDKDAATELIENNKGFLQSISYDYHNWYRNVRLDADDYTQIGSMALLRAAERYDEGKGAQFLTFAKHVVRNAILDEIRSEYPNESIVPLEERIWSDETVSMNSFRVARQLLSTYKTDPEHIYLQKEWLCEIHGAVNSLAPRGRTWVIARFGFDDDEYRSLIETARMFHLTESRAKKMEDETLVKVKTKLLKVWSDNTE